ncbi:MAG: hypothetical protein ACO4CI_09570 [Phycisphaerales bacterium]
MRPLLLSRQPPLEILVALAEEIHLELVALDGLVAALLALELLAAPTISDRLALVFLIVALVVIALGNALVFVVLVSLGRLLDDDQLFAVLVVFLHHVSHRSSPFR